MRMRQKLGHMPGHARKLALPEKRGPADYSSSNLEDRRKAIDARDENSYAQRNITGVKQN